MANVLDLRRRIRSVKNTRQITKAMKMVSAARLRRAQARTLAARPYAARITSVLNSLRGRIEVLDPHTGNLRNPLFATRPEERLLLIVVTGDRGFAGAFNNNIMKAAEEFLDSHAGTKIDVEAIGRKGRDLLRKRYPAAEFTETTDAEGHTRQTRERKADIEFIGDRAGFLDKLTPDRALELAQDVIARYAGEEIDACYVIYNEFKSVIQQRVVVERLLPLIEIGKRQITGSMEPSEEERREAAEAALSAGVSIEPADAAEAEEEAKKFGTASVDYIYEQPAEELFQGLLPQYISSMLFHSLAESVAAEHAARMTAMESATKNASDMINKYTLQMNRLRQAAITKEIIEIVSGAAAV